MSSLSYNAADIMINLLDFRRGFGLVHGVIAVSSLLMILDPTG